MSKMKKADFCYGAVLSSLFNHGAKKATPSLVDACSDSRNYDISTNQGDFSIIMQYRSSKSDIPRHWTFSFKYDEIMKMLLQIEENRQIVLALICVSDKLSDSELAILDSDDIHNLFYEQNKTNITISRKEREKFFKIHIKGKKPYKIPADGLSRIFELNNA